MNENKLNRYLFMNKLSDNKDKDDIDIEEIKEIKKISEIEIDKFSESLIEFLKKL